MVYPYLFLAVAAAAIGIAVISILQENASCQEERGRVRRRNSTSGCAPKCDYCRKHDAPHCVPNSNIRLCDFCFERHRKKSYSNERRRKIPTSTSGSYAEKCKICSSNPAVEFDPCGHEVACPNCIKEYKKLDLKCPVCRRILR